jgi:hypothetical protein
VGLFARSILAAAAAVAIRAQEVDLGPAPVAPEGVERFATKPTGARSAASWFDTSSRDAVKAAYDSVLVPTRSTPMGSTGNAAACAEGATTQAYKDAVGQRINWFRAMAGVPADVAMDSALSAKDQVGAMMLSANKQLSHTPPSSWNCYRQDGYDATSHSNICLAWGTFNDAGCVEAYMRDSGSNNAAAGHRRWFLYPQTTTMGTGDMAPSGSYPSGFPLTNAIWVIPSTFGGARPSTRDEFVAWPPRGHVPYQAVYPRWSFSYPGAGFGGATVSMQRGGQAVPVRLEAQAQGYGENTIVWVPDNLSTDTGSWPAPASDTTITVTVSNVVVGGSARSFTYNVVVFDPAASTQAPPAPTNPVPSSGATGASTATQLSWGASAGASSYEVYLGTTPNPAKVADTTTASYTPAGLVAGTTYYWRVSARNAQGASTSATWTFTTAAALVPGAPGSGTPVPGATSVPVTTSLAWAAAANATSYSVYFGASSNPPAVASSVSGTTYSPGPLAPSTTYYWRIVAWNAAGSTSSPTWTFTTAASAPLQITSPTEGQVLSTGGVTFLWTPVGSASGYEAVVRNVAGSAIFTGQIAGGGSNQTLISLPAGQFTFLLRSCAGGWGNTYCGTYSERRFSINPPAPAQAPAITNPSPGAVLTSSTATFAWTAVSGATHYELVLYNVAANQTDLTISPSGTSTVYTMRASSSFVLRVRACSSACGPWSMTVPFSTNFAPAPALAPTVTSATVANGNQLTAAWTSVANADVYDVQVVQPAPAGPGGGALTVASQRQAAAQATIQVPAGAAFVFVAACNGSGCGPYSAGAPFTAAGPNPAAPILGTPAAGSSVTGPAVVFSWSRVPGDSGSNTWYRLYVQDQSRQAAALDVLTRDNYYAAFVKADGTRYDAVVVANPGTAASAQGPASGFLVWGSSARAPTMTSPTLGGNVVQGNILLSWSPVPGASLYEYYVSGAGLDPAVRGTSPGTLVQVPLFTTGNAATGYSAIVRACPEGAACAPGSDSGWGPWSNVEGGSTRFNVAAN